MLRARTPASSPRGKRTGGVLSRVIASTSAKEETERKVLFKGVHMLGFCLKVCLSSPLMVCTWLSRSVLLWSTRSSRDAHGGNTSAFCEEQMKLSDKVCLYVKG